MNNENCMIDKMDKNIPYCTDFIQVMLYSGHIVYVHKSGDL